MFWTELYIIFIICNSYEIGTVKNLDKKLEQLKLKDTEFIITTNEEYMGEV